MKDYRQDVDEIYQSMIHKYKDTVYKVAYTYCKNIADAEDVFQDVFFKYFKKMPVFNTDEHEKAWFIKVTINCSKSLLRSAWYRRTVGIEEDIQFQHEEESELFYTVMQLPIKYRRVVHLYYYEDYSVKEISKILGIKETTIQTQLQRAREILKKELKGEVCYGSKPIQKDVCTTKCQ